MILIFLKTSRQVNINIKLFYTFLIHETLNFEFFLPTYEWVNFIRTTISCDPNSTKIETSA